MSFHENMNEYKRQLEKGAIQDAYRGLMEYFTTLRMHFKKRYPDDSVAGSTYLGYMDMTYFSFFRRSLKHRNLKIAIVFLHEEFRFEVWLSGTNKKILAKYMNLFREIVWDKYNIATTTKGVDSILDHIIVENPDFSDLDALTKEIESGTMKFTKDVEDFLSKHS